MKVNVKDIATWISKQSCQIFDSAIQYSIILNRCILSTDGDKITSFDLTPMTSFRGFRMFEHSLFKTGYRCDVGINDKNKFELVIFNLQDEEVHRQVMSVYWSPIRKNHDPNLPPIFSVGEVWENLILSKFDMELPDFESFMLARRKLKDEVKDLVKKYTQQSIIYLDNYKNLPKEYQPSKQNFEKVIFDLRWEFTCFCRKYVSLLDEMLIHILNKIEQPGEYDEDQKTQYKRKIMFFIIPDLYHDVYFGISNFSVTVGNKSFK